MANINWLKGVYVLTQELTLFGTPVYSKLIMGYQDLTVFKLALLSTGVIAL